MKEAKQTIDITHPEIVAEWHPTKNGDKKPSDFTRGSGVFIWWLCSKCGCEYSLAIWRRTKPGMSRCLGCHSLATLAPDLAKEWHSTLNGNLHPIDVFAGTSTFGCWWLCPDCHSAYEMRPAERTRPNRPHGCPFCAGRQVNQTNSLAAKHPELLKEWHPTLNGNLTPHDLTCSARTKCWWLCSDCGSAYDTRAHNKTNGSGCPYCNGSRVNDTNSLAMRYPKIASEWHPSKNDGLTPDEVSWGANRMCWWLCSECHSEYDAVVGTRTTNGNGCPYCAGVRVNNTNSFAALHPMLAAEWHPTLNDDKLPSDYVSGSEARMWWLCPECGSSYDLRILARGRNGQDCPYCAGVRLNDTNSLASLNPDIAGEWHPTKNSDMLPSGFVSVSQNRPWWLCENCGHEWQAVIARRTNEGKGTGCPRCARGKNERITDACLVELLPLVPIIRQFPVKRPGHKNPAQVDFQFCLNGNEYFVEYNGRQHYEPTNFGSMSKVQMVSKFEEQVARDSWLAQYCEEHEVVLLIIDGRNYKDAKIKPHLEEMLSASGAIVPR